MSDDSVTRLVGWKRIAFHLGCSERTARRWERDEGLPVKRQVHGKGSTVFGLSGELDDWLASRTLENGPPSLAASASPALFRRSVWGGVLAVGLVIAAAFVFRPAGPVRPSEITLGSEDKTALAYYRRGRALWDERGEEPSRRAIMLLQRSVAEDPDFAEAWAALAMAWSTLPTYALEISPEAAHQEAVLAANRALELDPDLAEARSVLADIALRRGNWIEARRIFEEALRVDPDNPSLLLWYAGLHREVGHLNKTWDYVLRAAEIDPAAPTVRLEIAMNTLQRGEIEEGEKLIDALWFEHGFRAPVTWFGKFMALDSRDRFDEMREWIDLSPFADAAPVLNDFVSVRENGSDVERKRLIEAVTTTHGNGFPGWFAFELLQRVGEQEAALHVAQKEASGGGFDNAVVLFDPQRQEARRSRGFAELTRVLGMTEYWNRYGPPDTCLAETDAPYCRQIMQADG